MAGLIDQQQISFRRTGVGDSVELIFSVSIHHIAYAVILLEIQYVGAIESKRMEYPVQTPSFEGRGVIPAGSGVGLGGCVFQLKSDHKATADKHKSVDHKSRARTLLVDCLGIRAITFL